MSDSPSVTTLQRCIEQRIEGLTALYMRDYALRDGVFTDACSMARLRRREG